MSGMLVGSAREVAVGGTDLIRIQRVHDDTDGRVDAVGLGFLQSASPPWNHWTEAGDVPDLSDPATAGCLLVMLVDALPPRSEVYLGREPRETQWGAGDGYHLHEVGSSPGEALALALLAVWGES